MRIDDENTLLCFNTDQTGWGTYHFHHLEKDKEIMHAKGQDSYRRDLIKYNVLNDGSTIQFIIQVHAKEDMEGKNGGNHYWISEEFNMLELFNAEETRVIDYEP